MVGIVGFEPTTFCAQGRRSIQAELHTDKKRQTLRTFYPYIAGTPSNFRTCPRSHKPFWVGTSPFGDECSWDDIGVRPVTPSIATENPPEHEQRFSHRLSMLLYLKKRNHKHTGQPLAAHHPLKNALALSAVCVCDFREDLVLSSLKEVIHYLHDSLLSQLTYH